MGITISSKRYSCDMGYGGFGRFRNVIAKQISEKVYSHYYCLSEPETMFLSGKKKDDFFKEYDAKTEELVKQGELTEEIANFLYQPDCEGKVNRNQAKEIYELIKDCYDNIVFGYIGRADCAKMSDLKKIFSDKTKVEWQ